MAFLSLVLMAVAIVALALGIAIDSAYAVSSIFLSVGAFLFLGLAELQLRRSRRSQPQELERIESEAEGADDLDVLDVIDEFPIEDYEHLTAAQVRAVLDELGHDELVAVWDREQEGKARRTVLTDIEERLRAMQRRPDVEPEEEKEEEPEEELELDIWEPPPPPPPPPPPLPTLDEVPDDATVFPIEDYDELTVTQIMAVLGELDHDELVEVWDREQQRKARRTVLARIEGRLAAERSGRRRRDTYSG